VRVDAHHHVWDLDVRDQPWTTELPALRRSFTLDDLRPELEKHHIDGTVVVQTVCVADETPELLALAAAEPTIVGVVGWVDLTDADVAENLEALRACHGGNALVGVRHQVQEEPDPRWLCRPDVRRGLAAVGAAGLVFDLLVIPSQLPAAAETVRSLPDVRFALDHAGKPAIATGELQAWQSVLTELSDAANVAVKLSGLTVQADLDAWTIDQLRPYAEALLELFGPDRVMFGSDWPVCLLAGTYDQTITAAATLIEQLDEAGQAAVFGDTAARWYGVVG